jgi:formate dehydrogenase major subunit
MVQLSRRQFMKVTGSTLAGSSLALMGFSPTTAMAEVRQYKLAATTVTRQTCTYCSVGCGILMHALGDGSKNAKLSVIHVEGDPDHPVNRGTLCPKGASLLDIVRSPNRLQHPEYRAPGSSEWKRISWDDALGRISQLLKADRDANFVEKTEDGKLVNRWLTTGMLAACNEAGYITHKVARSWGLLAFDNQARV